MGSDARGAGRSAVERDGYAITESSEEALWTRYLYAGLWAYVAVAAAALIYCAGTWSDTRGRVWLAVMATAALLHVPIVWSFRRRIVRRRYRLAFFVAWNMSSFVTIAIATVLDGGITSPIALVWLLPTIYLLLGYPKNAVWLCAGFGIALYLGTAALTPRPFPHSLFAFQLLLLAAGMLMVLLGAMAREWKEAQLAELRAQLAVLASTDELTGCLNQRAFLRAMEAEVERAARYQQPLSLLALDIDNFKVINDEYGHIAGDDALQRLGTALRGTVRKTDLVGRLGGDELAVLCPETDAEAAAMLAERLREAAKGRDMNIAISLSIGICSMRPGTGESQLLRYRADKALYEAKRLGRDRYVVFEPA